MSRRRNTLARYGGQLRLRRRSRTGIYRAVIFLGGNADILTYIKRNKRGNGTQRNKYKNADDENKLGRYRETYLPFPFMIRSENGRPIVTPRCFYISNSNILSHNCLKNNLRSKKRPPVFQEAQIVPAKGLEPLCPRRQWILSPPCLPFHHAGARLAQYHNKPPFVFLPLTTRTACSTSAGVSRLRRITPAGSNGELDTPRRLCRLTASSTPRVGRPAYRDRSTPRGSTRLPRAQHPATAQHPVPANRIIAGPVSRGRGAN